MLLFRNILVKDHAEYIHQCAAYIMILHFNRVIRFINGSTKMQMLHNASKREPNKEMTLPEIFEACQKNKLEVIGEVAQSVLVSLLKD